MNYRNLGKSGLRVPQVGLGCNNFGARIDLEVARKVVHKALDIGVVFFDTADTYGDKGGSELALGEILGPRRKDIILATKFAMQMDEDGRKKGASRRYIMEAVEASLKRLKTDWIDLYQQHRPDPLTPVEETLRALDDLVTQGKVRYVGNSNFAAWQAVEADWTAKEANLNRFVTCQNEYSLFKRGIEAELMPAMEAHGLSLLPFFPLANGMLTGKYKRNAAMPEGARLTREPRAAARSLTDRNWAIVEKLEAFAQERGKTLLELAFSWHLAHPVVGSVIAGATKPEQVEANAKAGDWKLTAEDMAAIDEITLGVSKAA
ncbi:MAG TPA: aldo/keto reductase [Alphaproteobacteria bacterium]